MKWLALTLSLAMPALSFAADGARCTLTPPSTVTDAEQVNNVIGACIDVCDKAINAAITCGPVWMPIQGGKSTTFEIYADASDCTFDDMNVILVNTSADVDALGLEQVILGTLDDDSGCGITGTTACHMVVVPYPIFGYVYISSGATAVGGASCAMKVRMKQALR